ncbi:MAG: 16S rRNA (guanine(527)-N(7))-methyltransferase RsmG [Coriobacteriia bacterium]|nr:16S rRNA (guanine(527)-N(7))-methyltransferase RsmG [Coriobacteriia bacterium]
MEHHKEELLRKHLQWVLSTNKIHNLTAITDEAGAWRLHVLDSLAPLPEIMSASDGPLLDIGSGGGFPGVPLGVMSERETVCLDSVKKKASALGEFLRSDEGYHNIAAQGLRAEELAAIQPDYYAITIARAVAQLNSIVELASPILQIGGVCLCMKAHVTDEEIQAGDNAAEKCGLIRKQIRNYTLQGGDETRCIVEYVKVAQPQVNLPRRTGVAQKRPLS